MRKTAIHGRRRYSATYPDFFLSRPLVVDVQKTMSIADFIDYLAELRAHGTTYVEACVESFLAANRRAPAGKVPHAGTLRHTIEDAWNDLASLFGKHAFVGAAETFVAYLKDFLAEFLVIAEADVPSICRSPDWRASHHRMAVYLNDLDLFDCRGKNIVEFCASFRLFSFMANALGHSAISTDIGDMSQADSYGHGAKNVIRAWFFGSNALNYALHHGDFREACSFRWFKDGCDVFAAHGTDIQVGRKAGREIKSADLKRSVYEVANYIRPCVEVLRPRGGWLSLRHVSLFRGYDPAIREELSHMLQGCIERSLGARSILCGIDPFQSPWASHGPGSFDYALVLRC